MQDVKKWPSIHTARFLEYAWAFFNIMLITQPGYFHRVNNTAGNYMFKINNKDTRATPNNFTTCSSVSIINFTEVNAGREDYVNLIIKLLFGFDAKTESNELELDFS